VVNHDPDAMEELIDRKERALQAGNVRRDVPLVTFDRCKFQNNKLKEDAAFPRTNGVILVSAPFSIVQVLGCTFNNNFYRGFVEGVSICCYVLLDHSSIATAKPYHSF
jgi:hypothetical protein